MGLMVTYYVLIDKQKIKRLLLSQQDYHNKFNTAAGTELV